MFDGMLPVVDEDQQEIDSFRMKEPDSNQKKFTLYLQRIIALLKKLEETGPLFFKNVTSAIDDLVTADQSSLATTKDLKSSIENLCHYFSQFQDYLVSP